MHILLIHQAFAAINEPGGTRHHEMARYLASQGHRITIIASPVSYLTGLANDDPKKRGHIIQDGKITILRTYTYSALHRSFVHRVFSFLSFMISSFLAGLRVHDVDLVWGTSPPIFQGLTAWALARLKRVPFLFEVRDLWPAFAIGVGVLSNPELIRASLWLERFLYLHADLVVVNSPGFIEHVQSRGAKRVELVPNGADPRMFDPDDDGEDFQRDHNLAGNFVAIYAGAHGMSNDLGMLLRAAEILQTNPNIIVILLGDGKEKPALQQMASDINLTNVRFLPSVSKVGMSQVLAAADACIAILKPIPLYKTVFPNKVFDYMAAGRPVVLAIDGVIREVVEQAEAGIFVPPGNATELSEAIKKLADDPGLARNFGANGRRCVEGNYDRAALTGRFAAIIEEIVR
ncbi:MAG: glycosyltransferase family 4 protein [Chloroflexota bacterium]|nr:glycosyltransferase family 4 protein [Chloroflexota bacterium]